MCASTPLSRVHSRLVMIQDKVVCFLRLCLLVIFGICYSLYSLFTGGCNVAGFYIIVLAYADDLVLLAPSWKALQSLLDLLFVNTEAIDTTCNVNKTFCMLFNPRDLTKVVAKAFPQFHLGGSQLKYGSHDNI